MSRPVKKRRVCELPKIKEFGPSGVTESDTVNMTIDEYETIRLIDHLGLSQEDCANQMDVARTTIQAIYTLARTKIADVLINGKRLHIDGGTYGICPKANTCCGKDCGRNHCMQNECIKNRPGCSKSCRQ